MSKILAESLYEFREENNQDIDEARNPAHELAHEGKKFRLMFLEGVSAMINKGKKDVVPKLITWLKKLKELGWPTNKELKNAVGEEDFKKLERINKTLNNNLGSYVATAGGSVSGKTSKADKSNVERLKNIAKVAGMEPQELADLLKKK